jgi:hypothetical protein
MIILPTAASTYADSTFTEGPLRRYVLAQFRDDASLEWVARTRAVLVKDELKYRDLREARPKLRSLRELWSQIERGIGQATIVVIDPRDYEQLVQDTLTQDEIERSGSREKAIIEGCASEIVLGTPLAYLPDALSHQLRWPLNPIQSLATFTPEDISRRLGGGLDKAMIFAARAHATFDVPRIDAASTTRSALQSSRLARVVLPEVLSTSRAFDSELPASTALLNEASEVIAGALEEALPILGALSDAPLVREVDSRGVDALQASDIAAGWARDMLETGEPRVLGSFFERVWLNGRRLK